MSSGNNQVEAKSSGSKPMVSGAEMLGWPDEGPAEEARWFGNTVELDLAQPEMCNVERIGRVFQC